MNKKNLRQYIYKVTLHLNASFLALHIILNRGGFGPLYNCGVLQNIIHSSGSVQDEMAHYLYVLQSITLNHLEKRMMVPLDCYNQVSPPPPQKPDQTGPCFILSHI